MFVLLQRGFSAFRVRLTRSGNQIADSHSGVIRVIVSLFSLTFCNTCGIKLHGGHAYGLLQYFQLNASEFTPIELVSGNQL
ncbi:hypothetical protein AYI69_g2942 [Smittium culicis]|uniref:Uncharacterized protein n=1 Tax=Smittium culicis TaxID=133412 RepID=A0A1R1YL21_9FUNG|nr:hypothetical protein AYI69_g2942 [Smittium culicis]